MKGMMNRVISVVLTLAMVLVSLNYTPGAVRADDYSNLNFTDISCDGGETISYYIIQNLTGATAPAYEVNGTVLKFIYSGDYTSNKLSSVKVNGEEVTAGGVYSSNATGCIIFDPTKMDDNAYTHILVTYNTSDVLEAVIKKGTPAAMPSAPSAFERVEGESATLIRNGYINSDSLGGVSNDTLVSYDLYFSKDASQIVISRSSDAGANGTATIYVDSTDSDPVGTVNITNSGVNDWNQYSEITADLSKNIPAGEHTIYMLFHTGGGTSFVCNVDYFQFIPAETLDLVAVKDAYIYNFTDADGGFELVFSDPNEDVYQDGYTKTYTVTIGDKTITGIEASGQVLDLSGLGLTEDAVYNVSVVAEYTNGTISGTSPASATTTFTYDTTMTSPVYEDDIPQIFITTSRSNKTSGINLYTDTSKTKVNAALMVKGVNGTEVLNRDYGTVNVRGNSTSLAAKKAYNIKFNGKQNLYGMGSAKKWCLLANIFDKTLLRNQIALNFQRELEENRNLDQAYTGACQPVDLYIDGRYLGSYLLTEAVEVGASRVNIDVKYANDDGSIKPDTEEKQYTKTYTVNNKDYALYDVLLEVANDVKERTAESDAYYFRTGLEYFAVNEPERDEDLSIYDYEPDASNKPAFVTATQTFLNDFEAALENNSYEVIAQYIDVNSFVDFYITSEYFMTKDINFSSTRFYIKDGKLYAGPLWDVDLSSGNIVDHEGYTDFYAQEQFAWFTKLMANETFAQAVKARYKELQSKIKALYADGGTVDTAYNDILKSATNNYSNAYNNNGTYTGWSITEIYGTPYGIYGSNTSYSTYAEYVNVYKTWLKNRNEWLCAQWGITDDGLFPALPIPGTGATLYQNDFSSMDGLTVYSGSTPAGEWSCADNTLTVTGGAGEKIIVTDNTFTNFVVEADIKVMEKLADHTAQGGIIFRTSKEASGGYDGYNGYYVGLDALTNEVMLGKVTGDGSTYTPIISQPMTIDYNTYYHVSIGVYENQIKVYINYNGENTEIITVEDSDFTEGHVGLRSFLSNTSFKNLKVSEYNLEETTTSPSTTTIDPIAEPEGAVWIDVPGTDGAYKYYVPAEYKQYFAAVENRAENIYFAQKEVGTPYQSVKLNNVNITNSQAGYVEVAKSVMAEYGAYRLDIVDFYGTPVSLYIRKAKISNYKPSGFTASVTDGMANVNWTPSADAIADGTITYAVTVGGNEAAVSGTSASYHLGTAYGTYEVVLKTYKDSVEVDSQTYTLKYKDPDAVDSELTVTELWEACRWEALSWTAVENATGYAIYADGELATTTTDFTYNLLAYQFANHTNSNGQPTTVGTHNVKVVALFDGEAPKTYSDALNKQLIGSHDSTLYVNYVYGNGTTLWNNSGTDSAWNFTICESNDDPNINIGADVNVAYNDDGSVNLTFNHMGQHAGDDQAWTIKAAVYDETVPESGLINLSFDIDGPATLAGSNIKIKCVSEEWANGDYTGDDAIYEEKEYTFEPVYGDDGTTVVASVLHYSNSFESKNSTYDLLFGLGLLDFKDGEKTLTLSNPQEVQVYGLKTLTPSGIADTADTTKGSIYASWTTNVPVRLANDYTYKVYIDDILVDDNAKSGDKAYEGYAVGVAHKVKVESIYNGTVTSTLEETVTIEATTAPDLVITDISQDNGDSTEAKEWFVGDRVPMKITMKNIGNADAVLENTGAGRNITVKAYANGSETEFGWYACDNQSEEDNTQILHPGESITKTIYYEVPENLVDGVHNPLFTIKAIADADDYVNGGFVAESNENNNEHEVVFIFAEKPADMNLTNDGTKVSASWDAEEDAKRYIVRYHSNGEEKLISVDGNITTCDFPIGEEPDNEDLVRVYMEKEDGSYRQIARATALADLVYDTIKLNSETGNAIVGDEHSIIVTVKNVGTAKSQGHPDEQGNIDQAIWVVAKGDSFVNGQAADYTPEVVDPNKTADITIAGYTPNVIGTDTVSFEMDDINRIYESNDHINGTNNNITTQEFNVVDKAFVQEKMDWVPLTEDGKDTTDPYTFEPNSTKKHIYYKIIDTSIQDKNYIDIIPTHVGYSEKYMKMIFADVMFNAEGENENTTVQLALIPNMEEDNIANAVYEYLGSQNRNMMIPDGSIEKDGSYKLVIDGSNTIIYNEDSFGMYKYYLMKITKEDGTYVTIAYKVTDENDEMNSWIKAPGVATTNPDKLPFYYHDTSYEVSGSFWYNGEMDNRFTGVTCYNDNYLALTISDTIHFNGEGKYRLEVAPASVDKWGAFQVPEDGFVAVPVYNLNGTNELQLQLPTLMKEFPVHSALGGEQDSEYYFMKVYYDTENAENDYVAVPIRITADIPEIEPVQGLAVTNRGDSLTVSWTSTATQISHGYKYNLYIDGQPTEYINVDAGTYNFSGYGEETYGETHTIEVVAVWCDQTDTAEVNYVIQEPQTEPAETLPDETVTIPTEDKWVKISGQNILPVLNDRKGENEPRNINAEIWYYTDSNLNSVVGYNEAYISLNGNSDYFTGESSKLFVQEQGSNTFVSKTVHDKFYAGQILISAENMFSTYGDWTIGTELYYTVRIAGNNGTAYKDFFFKIIPTEAGVEEPAGPASWKEISGESTLPVKLDDVSLEGKIYFYDDPSNTKIYDVVGYNSYYISLLGSGTYFTGSNTQLEISDPSATELYASDAGEQTFSSRNIYDKVWPGQIQVQSEKTFTVNTATTYYLLKITGEKDGIVSSTYLPMKVEAVSGDVEIQGFQMNTNTEENGVSHFNPSYRVVSRAGKVIERDGVLHKVTAFGTVYAPDGADMSKMTVEDAGGDIEYFEATDKGKYVGYVSGNGDDAYNDYYALTLKLMSYHYSSLNEKTSFRAYAVLDNGERVYGKNVYTVNMYEISQFLYENCMMATVEAHNFLYDNILNVVDMVNNANDISNAMNKALKSQGITPDYNDINCVYQDIFHYAYCSGGYTYLERGTFKSIRLGEEKEAEMLANLNKASDVEYDSLIDWIYGETEKYGNSKRSYKGCYHKVDYDWGSNLFTEYEKLTDRATS